jgi:hypothetical protein
MSVIAVPEAHPPAQALVAVSTLVVRDLLEAMRSVVWDAGGDQAHGAAGHGVAAHPTGGKAPQTT